MRYVQKKTQTVSSVQAGHVQHSKKLANWSLIQWVLIAIIVVAALFFADWTDAETDVLSGVVTWSATLAGIVVTGYMGNSSIEKYADRKFAITDTTDGKG